MKVRRTTWVLGGILLMVALAPVAVHFAVQAVHRTRMASLKAELVKDFADANSARFRNVSLRTDDTSGWLDRLNAVNSGRVAGTISYRLQNIAAGYEELVMLCGQVNAKNVFGAYVGFRDFYVMSHGAGPILDDGKDSKLAASMCHIDTEVVLTEP